MSDIAVEAVESAPVTESAPAEPSTPQTTADIAREIVTADAEPETPAPAVVEPPKERTAAQKFLEEQGHKPVNAQGRETWIRYSTFEKMLDRYLGQHKTEWDGTRTQLETRAKTLQEQWEEIQRDARQGPEFLLKRLAQIDPRYADVLRPPAPPPAPAVPDQFPEPDVQLGDGSGTFSLKGIQERIVPWLTRQIRAEVLGEVDQKLKPWQDRDKAEKARAEAEQARFALLERTRGQITQAQQLPNWKEYEPEVLKLLQEDSANAKAENRRPAMTLMEAYWQTRATKARDTVITEIQGAPKAPTVARSSGGVPKAQKESTADIARAVLRGAS